MSNPFRLVADFYTKNLSTNDVQQAQYSFNDTLVCVGAPLVKLDGLDSIKVRFLQPQTVFKPNIGGGGVFLKNRNLSAEIDLEFLQGGFFIPLLELFDATDIDVPLTMTDLSSGGTSSVVCTDCRVIDKGQWTRAKEAATITMKIYSKRTDFFHGMRLPHENIIDMAVNSISR